MSKSIEPEYEITRWRPGPFIYVGIGFLIVMILVFTIVAGLTVKWTNGTWPHRQPNPPPQENSVWRADVPQLQINAETDLAHVQIEEQAHLHSWGRSKDNPAYATIPIEEAIILLADQQRNPGLLPVPLPMTPLDLQNQKSKETQPLPDSP